MNAQNDCYGNLFFQMSSDRMGALGQFVERVVLVGAADDGPCFLLGQKDNLRRRGGSRHSRWRIG